MQCLHDLQSLDVGSQSPLVLNEALDSGRQEGEHRVNETSFQNQHQRTNQQAANQSVNGKKKIKKGVECLLGKG